MDRERENRRGRVGDDLLDDDACRWRAEEPEREHDGAAGTWRLCAPLPERRLALVRRLERRPAGGCNVLGHHRLPRRARGGRGSRAAAPACPAKEEVTAARDTSFHAPGGREPS